MIDLSIHKMLKSPGGEMALNVDIKVKKHSLVALFGESGAGKTSILRILAGLLDADSGKIEVNGIAWFDSEVSINISPQKRKVGYVFQDYALFPNMTVKENLKFALVKNQDNKVVSDLIEIIELGALQDRKPETLSGGQKQRVALARALVQRPEVLLLDEPLAALDHKMRSKLQQHLLEVHREFGLTSILVSHDISEILKLSDTIMVMEEGRITRQGTPLEIFSHKLKIGGKFQFNGEIIAIVKQDFIFIVTILIGRDLVKVVADEKEISKLNIGDKVLVASKAFNPIIKKIL